MNKKKSVFLSKDFKSGNGMSTFVWGPAAWLFLHTISFNYPEKPTKQQKKDYFNFFKLLQKVLPCKFCRENYTKNIKEKDTLLNIKVFKNRKSLSYWLYTLHNKINKNLNKNDFILYEEVRERYEHFRARCLNNKKKMQNGGGKSEMGCTNPLIGIKKKSILRIVPRNSKLKTFEIHNKCKYKRLIN